MFPDLVPEKLSCTLTVRIIKWSYITFTYPVSYTVFYSLFIHPAFFIEFLIMFRGDIKFWPYRDHDPGMKIMDIINHAFRIRKKLGIKFMGTPGINRPVRPVENYIIKGDSPFTVLFYNINKLILRTVTLATLPETHRPFWHNRCLPCKCTVSADHLVGIIPLNKIII